MVAAGRRLYVYYRVAREGEASAIAATQAMQARLCSRLPGLQAQVLRRVEGEEFAPADRGDGSTVTLMEVYSAPRGVDAACVAEIEAEAARLPFATPAPARHLELFEPCASGG